MEFSNMILNQVQPNELKIILDLNDLQNMDCSKTEILVSPQKSISHFTGKEPKKCSVMSYDFKLFYLHIYLN
jgi:hypothetical protein